MTCPQCRHENEAGAKFCEECATPLARACAKCGRPLSPTAKFCPECAHPTGSSAAPAPAQRFDSPESYTPRHLAEKILTSKAALEGERKQVTILFADLKGSMELLADRDPEEARKLLDPVLQLMMDAVHRYEGTVNQVMGDGIMALFGAPIAHEDHAVRACYAALRMQDSVKQYAEAVRRAEGVFVQIRVGLNSGEVVVRAIGSDLHMDYTAVGQTTHLAGRMEQMAAPGSILLTAEVLRLAEGYVGVKPLGPMAIKGLSEPIDVYEVTGAGPVRTRLQAAAARGLTQFVGRDREVEQLRQGLERAAAGHGQVSALVGEPGVGKSRLVWEVTHSHRSAGWLIVQTSSVSYGKGTPYLPVIDLLNAYFQIEARDDQRRMREKVMGKLLALDRSLEPSLPAFLALLDVPVEDGPWVTLDPPQRRQRSLEAIKRLLLREAQVQPLLLVFEDLHWIDGETQSLLDSLVDSLPVAHLLLLVNYRPEYQHAWGSKTYYRQLRIDPLPPESAAELLETILGRDAALGTLKRLLVERTEANPLFLEESVRALVETGVLAGDRGAHRLTRPVEQLTIPATVRAILAARIDRLAPEAKRLLQAAVVIGKDVPLPLLLAIADAPESEVRAELTRLQAAEFLYEARFFPDLEYTFKHALTHEVTYGSLLQDRRRALHARIVEAIEALYANRLAEHVERLADHAFRGETWAKALAYCHEAGAKAAGRSAYREALAMLERAQIALSHLPECRDTLEHGVDLRLDFQSVFNALGDLQRMLDSLAEAERLAESLGDGHRLARVLAYTSRCFWWMGTPDRSVATGTRALAIATTLNDGALEAVANYHLGVAYVSTGDFRRAVDVYRRSAEILTGPLERDRFGMPALPSVIWRAWQGYSLACLGDFGLARSVTGEAVQLAEAIDHPYSVGVAVQGVGLVSLIQGDVPHALHWLERGIQLSRDGGFAVLLAISTVFLGRALTLAGRVAEGLTLLDEEAVSYCSAIRFMAFRPATETWLADAHLQAGRGAEAITTIERALHLTRVHGQRVVESEALLGLAAIRASGDVPELDQGLAKSREALSLAEELGMRPLVAHCHLGLGRLYRRTGDQAQANGHLTTAMTMYREMDMRFWLEKAEAALGGVER
jgi:class 3 adenylate cyclase/tetratricopeptide (TPR) repeat protein